LRLLAATWQSCSPVLWLRQHRHLLVLYQHLLFLCAFGCQQLLVPTRALPAPPHVVCILRHHQLLVRAGRDDIDIFSCSLAAIWRSPPSVLWLREHRHLLVFYQHLLVLCAFAATSSSSYALAETTSTSPPVRWLPHGHNVLPCSGCESIATCSCSTSTYSCSTSTFSCCVHSTPPPAPRTRWQRRYRHLLLLAGCDMAIASFCALAARTLPPPRVLPAPPGALCIRRHHQLVVHSGRDDNNISFRLLAATWPSCSPVLWQR